MTTSRSDLLQIAKQGDIQAISALINYRLNAKSITAKLSLEENCLHIVLEAVQPLEQTAVANSIRSGMTSLAPKNIEKIKISAKQPGRSSFNWSNEFELKDEKIISDTPLSSRPVKKSTFNNKEVKPPKVANQSNIQPKVQEKVAPYKSSPAEMKKRSVNENIPAFQKWLPTEFSTNENIRYAKLVGAIVIAGIVLFTGYRSYAVWAWQQRYDEAWAHMEEACDAANQQVDETIENQITDPTHLLSERGDQEEARIVELQTECQARLDAIKRLPPKPF